MKANLLLWGGKSAGQYFPVIEKGFAASVAANLVQSCSFFGANQAEIACGTGLTTS